MIKVDYGFKYFPTQSSMQFSQPFDVFIFLSI